MMIFEEDEGLNPDFTDDLFNMAPLDVDEDVEDNAGDDYDLMSKRDFKILNRKLNLLIQLTEVPTQTSKQTDADKLVTEWSKKFSDQEQKIKELVDAFAEYRSQVLSNSEKLFESVRLKWESEMVILQEASKNLGKSMEKLVEEIRKSQENNNKIIINSLTEAQQREIVLQKSLDEALSHIELLESTVKVYDQQQIAHKYNEKVVTAIQAVHHSVRTQLEPISQFLSHLPTMVAATLILADEAESSRPRTRKTVSTSNVKEVISTRYSPKRPVENDANETNLESNTRSTSGAKSQIIEVKNQKKTNDTGLQINGHSQTNTSANLETKFEKSLSSGQLDSKRRSCAFCHSFKQTEDTYLMFCPEHATENFPSEMESEDGKQDTDKRIFTLLNPCTTPLDSRQNLVFCGSDLSSEEKCSLVEFARNNRAVVSKYWRSNVTHVITATDSIGACTRSYKVLMAILNGKWIVTVEWVKACVEAGCLVNEEPYEVTLDTHGCTGGPKAGRLRVLNNAPKLFNNLKFYFAGDYLQAYKTDLLNLVTTAGGTIIKARDQLLSSSNDADEDMKRVSLVVYNADLSDHSEFDDADSIRFQRLVAAEDIAQESQS